MEPPPPTPPRAWPWARIAVALVLAELLLSAVDLLLGPFLRVHWEERFNARNGVLFACGHLDAAFDLQYRTFCGGCTTESLMAAPLFRWLGASHLVWKLVPELFHAVITAAGAALAGRAAGPKAAAAFAALMLGHPASTELAHTAGATTPSPPPRRPWPCCCCWRRARVASAAPWP